MPRPQTTTAPVIPSSGKPGLLLHGASSSRKRVNQQEDAGELWPKKARPIYELSPVRSHSGFGSVSVTPKIESSLLESQYRCSAPAQTLPDVSLPSQDDNLTIKREVDDLATNNALNHTGASYIPVYTQNTRWDTNSDNSYAPLAFDDASLQDSVTASHALGPPSNIPCRAENVVREANQQVTGNISSCLTPSSHSQPWPLGTTQSGGWSAITHFDPSQFADHISLYADIETPFPNDLYSDQISTLSVLSPEIYIPLSESTDTGSPHRHQHIRTWYSPQSMQKPHGVELAVPQPAEAGYVSQDLHPYQEPIGSHYGYFKAGHPNLPLHSWPAQGLPHDTFTGGQDRLLVLEESPVSPEWNENLQPVHGHSSQGQGIPDVQSTDVGPVKVDAPIQGGSGGLPAAVQSSYDHNSTHAHKKLDLHKPSPKFGGLPANRRPRDPGSQWPIHPDHDPAVLFACQSSRQGTDEIATGASHASIKPRKQFNEGERQETSRTRDIGACVRCKMQRVRCRPNPDFPDGPCDPCLKVARNPSKKVIHHIGCHRYKLQEITIFRTSPTPVNPKRWQTAQVRDVITYGEPIFVKLQQRLGQPFVIRVSAFVPLQDDETTRAGRDHTTGEEYDEPLGLFALKRAHDVIDDYRAYIKDNWYREFADRCARPEDSRSEVDGLIADIYGLSLRHLDGLPLGPSWDLYRSSTSWDPKALPERSFMQATLMMCFVLRQALGQSWIDPDGLDPNQWPRHEKFSPLKGLPGTPRMIVSQLDCIRISCVLRPLAKPLLKVLMTWIAERRHDCWLSIFYASFIFLREIALATQDAYDHGKRKKTFNPNNPKPNHHSIIAEMHESANVILAHWHYFNCSVDVENLDEKARGKSPLRQLTPEQFETVKSLWKRIRLWKTGRPQCQNAEDTQRNLYMNSMGFKWCHPLYFASQMFEPSWSPLEVFTS